MIFTLQVQTPGSPGAGIDSHEVGLKWECPAHFKRFTEFTRGYMVRPIPPLVDHS